MGMATQADEVNLRAEKLTLSRPYFSRSAWIWGSSSGMTLAIMACCWGERTKVPLCTLAISAIPVLKGFPGESCTRPFSMKTVK